jgi:hypothetical protein
MTPLIPDWSDEQRSRFLRRPVSFAHRIADSGLVEDAALVRLLDRYPAEAYDINRYSFDADDQVSLQTGVRGRADGAELLAAIKSGRVWVNLRQAATHYPELGSLVHAAFAELEGHNPGFRVAGVSGQLILSSPGNRVPYHADPTGVVLYHLRGRKRMWVYPVDEAFVPQAHMEKIALRETTEELPYRREMDAAAEVFDLEPGMAVTWPVHAPHRVDNLDSFNVSYSADYLTWPSRLNLGAFVAGGVLRRWGLPVTRLRERSLPTKAALWAASLAMRRTGLVRSRLADFERSFELAGAAAT